MSREAGKGSSPRPFSVTQEQYDQRWEAIFGRDRPKNSLNEVIDYSPSMSYITEDGEQEVDD